MGYPLYIRSMYVHIMLTGRSIICTTNVDCIRHTRAQTGNAMYVDTSSYMYVYTSASEEASEVVYLLNYMYISPRYFN